MAPGIAASLRFLRARRPPSSPQRIGHSMRPRLFPLQLLNHRGDTTPCSGTDFVALFLEDDCSCDGVCRGVLSQLVNHQRRSPADTGFVARVRSVVPWTWVHVNLPGHSSVGCSRPHRRRQGDVVRALQPFQRDRFRGMQRSEFYAWPLGESSIRTSASGHSRRYDQVYPTSDCWHIAALLNALSIGIPLSHYPSGIR